jgi:hypothetical protein
MIADHLSAAYCGRGGRAFAAATRSCCATGASVTFCTVAAIQLIAAIDLLQILIGQKLVKQDEVEVTRNCKVMLQPNPR